MTMHISKHLHHYRRSWASLQQGVSTVGRGDPTPGARADSRPGDERDEAVDD